MDITTIVVYLKDLLATVLTLLMMMSPAFGGNEITYTAEKPDEVIMSFSAVSDIHVESNNPKPYNVFYDVLEGLSSGEDNDAVVFLGDNTMNGQSIENLFFFSAVKAISPAEKIFVALGNHDIGNGEGDYGKFVGEYIINNRLFTMR